MVVYERKLLEKIDLIHGSEPKMLSSRNRKVDRINRMHKIMKPFKIISYHVNPMNPVQSIQIVA